ncbi:MAG: SHOCT domain-containing protein [Alkaliphilus sp.]|nr:SHOCT domain-containing protein [Alkaliphilus sp.]
MMYGSRYNGINSCFERFGFMHNGIGMILVFILILAITVTIILLLTRNSRHKSGDSALKELKLRYAKGELSEEEFLKRKHLIDM